MTRGHEAWEELAAGYALDALEPEDEQVFAGHLRGCDLCTRTLADLHALAGQMAYAASPVSPPAALRRAIVAGLAGAAQPPVATASVPPQRFPWRVSPYRVAAAAVAVAVFAVAVWNVGVRDQRDAARIEAGRLRRLVAVINDDSTRSASLTSATSAGAARATAYVRGDKAWLVVDGLPANDAATSTYVLWWQDRGGGMNAMVSFDVPGGGTRIVGEIAVAVPAARIAALAISKEAGRTIPAGPSAPIVIGSLEG